MLFGVFCKSCSRRGFHCDLSPSYFRKKKKRLGVMVHGFLGLAWLVFHFYFSLKRASQWCKWSISWHPQVKLCESGFVITWVNYTLFFLSVINWTNFVPLVSALSKYQFVTVTWENHWESRRGLTVIWGLTVIFVVDNMSHLYLAVGDCKNRNRCSTSNVVVWVLKLFLSVFLSAWVENKTK